eukprot:TRINITY_DN3874_c0_g5_i2.p1 TRINITY_DN3874_c0_g5~~TRINITY_DN3874_c0_g5_i2.p1  ORF type:complete len:234 (+),score=60.27 TRINITY_DN3874_c0_g5_i2:100-801(+)
MGKRQEMAFFNQKNKILEAMVDPNTYIAIPAIPQTHQVVPARPPSANEVAAATISNKLTKTESKYTVISGFSVAFGLLFSIVLAVEGAATSLASRLSLSSTNSDDKLLGISYLFACLASILAIIANFKLMVGCWKKCQALLTFAIFSSGIAFLLWFSGVVLVTVHGFTVGKNDIIETSKSFEQNIGAIVGVILFAVVIAGINIFLGTRAKALAKRAAKLRKQLQQLAPMTIPL